MAALGWLRVASLLTAAPRAVAEGDSVLLSWTPPGAGRPVHLRAQGFGRDYYRMDTRPSGPSFRWSTDVLRASGRSIEDLGIAAWTTAQLDGAERRLYLPVSLGSAAAPAAGELVLDLEPAQELQEVYVSVARTGPDGVAAHYLRDGSEELGYGYYPAGERLRVALGPIDAAGTYRVEVASLLANGTLASHELWFLSGD